MTDNVYFNDGDSISEGSLRAIQSRGLSNYVDDGLGLTLDPGTPALDIDPGIAHLKENGSGVTLSVDGRSGLALTDGATNYVYLTYDPNAGDVDASVEYVINTTATPPSTPSLLVGLADTSSDTTTAENRSVATSIDTLNADTLQKVEYTAGYLSGSTSAGIEEAIAELPDDGGVVVVGPPGDGNGADGAYEVTDNTPLDGFDDVTIVIPPGSTLRQADGTGFNRILQLSDITNVTLEIHGTLDANRTGQSGVTPVNALRITDFVGAVEDLTIKGTGAVTGTRRYAIRIEGDNGNGTTNLTIEGLTFEDHRSDTDGNSPHPVLQFDGGSEAPAVRDCVFRPVKNDGLHISMADLSTTYGVVEGCRFEYDDGQYRIAFMGSDSATFRENRIYPVVSSVTGVGDMVRTNGPNTSIENNLLIGLENTDRGIVLGTTSLSSDQTGVSACGNVLVGIGNPGIEARGNTSGGKVKSPLIQYNKIFNCNQNGNAAGQLGSAGVALDATINPRVSENVIADTQGTPTQETPVVILSSVTDAELSGNQYYGHATEDQANDSGARTRYDGTVFLSGAPSASNYGSEDAGTKILDTSTSPEDLYFVLTDGTLSGSV